MNVYANGNEIPIGLTFDDVLLRPGFANFLPKEADVTTCLTNTIKLNIPLLSAAMDTVTEHDLAIAMAQEGGIGVIHKNLDIAVQSATVDRVKRSVSGMITDPVTIEPHQSVEEALTKMKRHHISGIPVTENGRALVGIVTNRDLRFVVDVEQPVSALMTSDNLITVRDGTGLDEAQGILHHNRIEKLLVVDDDGQLMGLITIKDIEKRNKYPFACKDEQGRLRVGAAIGFTEDRHERLQELIRCGVDAIFIDSAHGHSINIKQMVEEIKGVDERYQVIAGNVATAEATKYLIDAGADAVKVGMGPASICTTRVVAGIGVPQFSAIMECARVGKKHNIPIIADGGIKYSGDVTKALAAGAHSVMIGSLFAGTDESPGELVLYQGRSYKMYRGMGSLGAMAGGHGDRYGQGDERKLSKFVPEGVEGRIPSKGPLAGVVYQLLGGVRAGMGYTGCRRLEILRLEARWIQVTNAGFREGHVHDVIITQGAPNYPNGHGMEF